MTDTESLVRSISDTLSNIENLGDGIYKGQRVFNGRVFATAYFDLSDHIIDRANNLSEFQERLIGSDFFNADSEQRWNSYLFFWAGPNSKIDERFAKAKAQIERDRHYARKFVVTEDDLIQRLSSKEDTGTTISEDASVKWEEILKNASLGLVLEQYPRTQVLESIATGEAFKIEKKNNESSRVRKKDALSTGFIKSLSVGTFRPILNGREFEFGDVNLIFGQNGAGKTSLLESIEAFYCGRARRDLNATLRNTTAKIITSEGNQIEVKSEHTPAIFKGRNLAWYGRSNPQSDAIIHSFTRFNFLDTDAAFRLAGETDPKKIREDLSLLLVGEESGTLWTYLTKLQQEANAKFIGLKDRFPILLSQTKLLGSEVERLKSAPSEANTLITTFRSNIRKLGGKWLSDGDASLSVNDRIKLEFLYKGFGRAITVLEPAISNWDMLDGQILKYSNQLEKINILAEEFDSAEEKFVKNLNNLDSLISSRTALNEWLKFCEAGVPELTESIEETEKSISLLRNEVGSSLVEEISELPAEYESSSLETALNFSSLKLQEATERERVNTEQLQFRERLGQSLSELRFDLHGLLNSIIEKTGDTQRCPVCETFHPDGELLHKIERLIGETDSSESSSFRQAVLSSKEDVARETKALLSLKSLERYAFRSNIDNSLTVKELRLGLLNKIQHLILLNENLERSNNIIESLDLLGLNWSEYENTRNLASAIMSDQSNISNLSEVVSKIESLSQAIESSQLQDKVLSKKLNSLSEQTATISKSFGIDQVSPRVLRADFENTLELLNATIAFLYDARVLIDFRKNQSFQELQLDLSDLITDFDKAYHAQQSEQSARTQIHSQTIAFEEVSKQLTNLTSRQENLSRAIKVFDEIINNHSLEQATQEALRSIGGKVGDIFRRIHSPCEYAIGDFMGNNLLHTLDGEKPHGIHQVSTGQRAALALSIFLALNRSALSAPPVMLIDDPVAHIDDLNALSFLDYLRDIVVSSRKQIFFATADAKFAALFQRKFEFLGQDRFKKIMMSR